MGSINNQLYIDKSLAEAKKSFLLIKEIHTKINNKFEFDTKETDVDELIMGLLKSTQ